MRLTPGGVVEIFIIHETMVTSHILREGCIEGDITGGATSESGSE